MIRLIHGDCLEKMRDIPDGSIDLVLTDPPYGTTACKWDTVIPFEPMWEHLKRVTKKNGAIILFGSQPFTSALVMSNVKMFKYEWIWEKSRPTNQMLAKKQALKSHENVLLFSKVQTKYNPQMWKGEKNHGTKEGITNQRYLDRVSKFPINVSDIKYPRSVIKVQSLNPVDYLHPTQKPVALMEYLIKTYTNEGETVLDFCAGSFTTAVACDNLKRKWICIEKEEEYCNVGRKRIEENKERLRMLDNCVKLDI